MQAIFRAARFDSFHRQFGGFPQPLRLARSCNAQGLRVAPREVESRVQEHYFACLRRR
jgi:hypothetical protein